MEMHCTRIRFMFRKKKIDDFENHFIISTVKNICTFKKYIYMTDEFLRKERCGIHMFAGVMHVLNTAFFPLTVFF